MIVKDNQNVYNIKLQKRRFMDEDGRKLMLFFFNKHKEK